jgi:Polysaccharide pyruvyl transferase
MRIATIQGPLEIGLDYHRYVPAAKMDQAASPALDYDHPHNIGDWFVTKATDRLLAYDDLVIIRRDAPDRDWQIVNDECDALVLKGGNYIQADWLTREFGIELFRKIKIPIIMFGVGLQADRAGRVEFEPDEVEILRYIHDSCACSSVRGNSTAEALASVGIQNFVVTACPTAYWSRRPEIVVRPPRDDCAGFSFRQSLYTSDPAVYAAQFAAVETVRDRFGTVTVILQGEEVLLQRYMEARRWGAEHEARLASVPGTTLTRLTRTRLRLDALRHEIHDRFDPFTRPDFLDWFMNNSFFSYDIGEYLQTYRKQGMVVGCRLHSNLVSLANGTPTVFLTYDQRTQELAELLELPHRGLMDFGPDFDLFGQDWRPFEKNYAFYYAEMRRFLDANGLPHRLEL